jgi:hypothetical protein
VKLVGLFQKYRFCRAANFENYYYIEKRNICKILVSWRTNETRTNRRNRVLFEGKENSFHKKGVELLEKRWTDGLAYEGYYGELVIYIYIVSPETF